MTVTNTSRLEVKKFPALDDFRLLAVILVVANHTRSADGEFLWVLTALRRLALEEGRRRAAARMYAGVGADLGG